MAALQDPEPAVPRKPFSTFKLCSFDIFGTCVDWESSFDELLSPLKELMLDSHPLKADREQFLITWGRVENKLNQEQPKLRYDKLLSESYKRFVRSTLEIGEDKMTTETLDQKAEAFGQCVESFKPYPDTVDAMKKLKSMGYRLVPLSNIDHKSWNKTRQNALKGAPFDTWYLAEDIGSYKPDPRNFEYLISHVKHDFGVEKDEILHIAKALYVDHVTTKKMGMHSVFIDRQNRVMGTGMSDAKTMIESGQVGYGWRFETLGDLADAIENELNSS